MGSKPRHFFLYFSASRGTVSQAWCRGRCRISRPCFREKKPHRPARAWKNSRSSSREENSVNTNVLKEPGRDAVFDSRLWRLILLRFEHAFFFAVFSLVFIIFFSFGGSTFLWSAGALVLQFLELAEKSLESWRMRYEM